MQFTIIHKTIYTFESEVFLEPHYFRFKLKDTPYAQLKEFCLNVSPEPIGLSEQLDVENNSLHFAWFEGSHQLLEITATATLQVEPYNPFHFLIAPPHFNQFPFEYANADKNLLKACLEVEPLGDTLTAYTRSVAKAVGQNTLGFLMELTLQIHADFKIEIRELGPPLAPDATYKLKKGSCRDLAWMQIQMLRNLGMATRFVSGYFYVEAVNPTYELHAWTEVYLPGAGWIGYDPTNGLKTTHLYFPVACSANYQNTMPVSGSIRGEAPSRLTTHLEMVPQ